MGRIPNDIINIVKSMKKKDEIKRLNWNYYDKYFIFDSIIDKCWLCLYYKSVNKKPGYFINCRNIRCETFRKEIVCFITNTLTKYEVPKIY